MLFALGAAAFWAAYIVLGARVSRSADGKRRRRPHDRPRSGLARARARGCVGECAGLHIGHASSCCACRRSAVDRGTYTLDRPRVPRGRHEHLLALLLALLPGDGDGNRLDHSCTSTSSPPSSGRRLRRARPGPQRPGNPIDRARPHRLSLTGVVSAPCAAPKQRPRALVTARFGEAVTAAVMPWSMVDVADARHK